MIVTVIRDRSDEDEDEDEKQDKDKEDCHYDVFMMFGGRNGRKSSARNNQMKRITNQFSKPSALANGWIMSLIYVFRI